MTEQWIPGNTPELIAAIEREWQELMQVINRLTPEQMNKPDEGGWSPKDNLAHLMEWMNILLGYYMDKRPSHEVAGVSPEVTKDWDMEIINPVLFERHRERPAAEVMDEAKRVYARLVEKLRATPFEDLMKPCFPDDPDKSPLILPVLGNTTEHFEEHRETIEKMLK